MLVDIITTKTFAKSGAIFSRRVLLLKCDECSCSFERRYGKKESEKEYHFCSRACKNSSQKPGGIINNKIISTNIERLGVSYPGQSEAVKEKFRETSIQNWGVDHPFRSKEMILTIQESNIEKYGQKYASMCDEQKKKAEKTCIAKYGKKSPLQNDSIKEKQVETCRKNNGVDYPMQSKRIREKSKLASLDHYGTEHPAQSDIVKDKIKKTCQENFGYECYLQTPENRERCNSRSAWAKRDRTMRESGAYKARAIKAHNTMKENGLYAKRAARSHETMKNRGTYGKSMIEDRFYGFLCEKYGKENVERQVLINGWVIDFKVNEAYIQFDGVYWHGLDRDIEIIKEFKNPRDKTIYGTYCRDQLQNAWFKENNKELLRITDKQFRDSNFEPILVFQKPS